MTNYSTTSVDAPAASAIDAVADRAEETTGRTSDALEATARQVERAGRRMGDRVATVADKAASALGSTAEYVREFDARDAMDEMKDIAKRHPVAVLALAVVAGFLVGRSASRT